MWKKIKKALKKAWKKEPEPEPNPTPSSRSYNPRKRKVFTPEDDMKIIRFLQDNQNIGTPDVWKEMENQDIVGGGWSWKSLRSHFQYLKDRKKLDNYNLTAEEQDNLIRAR